LTGIKRKQANSTTNFQNRIKEETRPASLTARLLSAPSRAFEQRRHFTQLRRSKTIIFINQTDSGIREGFT
jgi:hypothetical protein